MLSHSIEGSRESYVGDKKRYYILYVRGNEKVTKPQQRDGVKEVIYCVATLRLNTFHFQSFY